MVESDAIAKYEFRRKLEELQEHSGRGTELISLYVPPHKQISDVSAYLRNEYSQSSNIKSKSTRKNVMGAIESIMSRLKYFRAPPENGVVFFVGHVATSGDQTRMVSHTIEPPEPVTTFLYRCDSRFHLEPLFEMLAEKEIYGLIVVDRSEATIGFLNGKRICVVKNVPSRVPRKHRMGGQSALRFERLIEIAAHEFFVKVGDIANGAFLNEKGLKGILVGGPGATKDYLVEKDYLHHELKKKVISTFDTGYTDESGLRELVDKSAETLSGIELMKEKKLMRRFFEEIIKPGGGLSAYGEENVRNALSYGAVEILLLSDTLRKHRLKYKCPGCGHEAEETGNDAESSEMLCRKCQTSMNLIEKRDIIKDISEVAEKYGTDVSLVSGESEEGEILIRAFGGMAAILRYKIAG